MKSISTDTLWGGKRALITVDGHTGFVIQPPVPPTDKSKPWVWYAHTFITGNSYPNSSNGWYLSRLISSGFWICGIDVGESYGSPAGRVIYSHFYDTLMARYHLNPKMCLHPQSRGGLMLYNWAAEPGNAEKVDRIAGIYPVGDLRSYPGLSEGLATTYGMTLDSLTAHLTENNPIDRLKPLYDAGVKILHIHGDNDIVVPLSANSQVIFDRYTAMGGHMTLIVVPDKGHAEIPEFFQSQIVLDFMLQSLTTSVENKAAVRVRTLTELIVSPNPFQTSVIVETTLPDAANARLDIFSLNGKKVMSEIIASHNGRFSKAWQGLDNSGHQLPSGFYVARITAGPYVLKNSILLDR